MTKTKTVKWDLFGKHVIDMNGKESYFKSISMNELFYNKYLIGYLSAVIGWIVAFIVPLAPFLIFTTILVLCDLFTGTRAALARGEKIHSRGLRRTVEKISVYFVAILLTEGMIDVFNIPINITYAVAFVIALSEFKSNIENVESISGISLWKTISEKITPHKPK